MVLALILQFNKLNSYLIIWNTPLFHRFETSTLSYSTGAKDNGANLKGINFCGAKTFAKFVETFHILCKGFSHVLFHNFGQIFLFAVPFIVASLITDSRKFILTKCKNFAKGIDIACFYCQKFFPFR